MKCKLTQKVKSFSPSIESCVQGYLFASDIKICTRFCLGAVPLYWQTGDSHVTSAYSHVTSAYNASVSLVNFFQARVECSTLDDGVKFLFFFSMFKFDNRICYEKKFFVRGYQSLEATFQSVQEGKWLKHVSNRILL